MILLFATAAAVIGWLVADYVGELRLGRYSPNEIVAESAKAAFAAWRKIGNLRGGASMRPWFLGIVANQCRSMKRSRWWSVTRVEPTEREAPAVDLAASIDLRRALRRIGHDERLLLVLRYYLDMRFEEIAVTIGTTPKAARTRVERAIRRLRPILQQRGATV